MKANNARFGLTFIALIYIIFALMFFVAPASFAPGLGFENLSPEALIEIRAIYGGLELALGLSLLYFTYTKQESVAAYLALIPLLGFAGGRLIGICIGGALGLHLCYLAFELFLAALAFLALKQSKGIQS